MNDTVTLAYQIKEKKERKKTQSVSVYRPAISQSVSVVSGNQYGSQNKS